MPRVSAAFFAIGGLLLLSGMLLGEYMGAHENFALAPLHAHINLLGWTSMVLTGLLYRTFPAAARSSLANTAQWLGKGGIGQWVRR